MHGRLKVKTTEQQEYEKKKKQQKKLQAYQNGMKLILSTRKKDSYNRESFDISTQLLSVNPDIYTLWNYRKEIVLMEKEKCDLNDIDSQETLIKFLDGEINLTERCLKSNPKSYGSWHHRYWILMLHPTPNWDNEFDLCTKYLTYDDRNFHCWDYRRQLINKIGITLPAEIQFSTDRLNANFSNYSSWHYRSTLRALDNNCIEDELQLVLSAVFTDPNDSSPWFYFKWILNSSVLNNDRKQQLLNDFEQLYELEPNCKWILMVKCWLSGDLDNKKIQYYKNLIDLDPLRRGQYECYIKMEREKL